MRERCAYRYVASSRTAKEVKESRDQGRRHLDKEGVFSGRKATKKEKGHSRAEGIQRRMGAHGRPRAKEASRAREEDASRMQVGRRHPNKEGGRGVVGCVADRASG